MNITSEFLAGHAPCYVYDSEKIVRNCENLTGAIPQARFLYSVKTNPFAPILKLVQEKHFGADASSVMEVEKALAAGMVPENIFFSTPGKNEQDIQDAYGKCTFIADSFHELMLLDQEAQAHNEILSAGVRINPVSAFHEKESPSKFGIDEELFIAKVSELQEFRNLKVSGIHVHVQSQILDTEMLEKYYERCFDLAERMNQLQGIGIQFINFGSGIGMVYDDRTQSEVDLTRLTELFERLQVRNESSLHAALYIETGRYVVGNAGRYYVQIVDIKESRGKKYLVINNGMNGFFRPTVAQMLRKASGKYPKMGMEPLYTCENEFSVKVLNKAQEMEVVTVVGNLCTAQDVICEDMKLNKAEIGDFIEITNAGSYGYSLSPVLFAGNARPKELLI